MVPTVLTFLAEAHGARGEIDEALHTLAEAEVLIEKNGERWWESETHRLKGELLLSMSSDNAPEAETRFGKALDVARRQQAKSLELRAATSQARLWRDQGKMAEAHELLVPVYNWFTEGFDTPDLQDAKALLDELG